MEEEEKKKESHTGVSLDIRKALGLDTEPKPQVAKPLEVPVVETPPVAEVQPRKFIPAALRRR